MPLAVKFLGVTTLLHTDTRFLDGKWQKDSGEEMTVEKLGSFLSLSPFSTFPLFSKWLWAPLWTRTWFQLIRIGTGFFTLFSSSSTSSSSFFLFLSLSVPLSLLAVFLLPGSLFFFFSTLVLLLSFSLTHASLRLVPVVLRLVPPTSWERLREELVPEWTQQWLVLTLEQVQTSSLLRPEAPLRSLIPILQRQHSLAFRSRPNTSP